MTRIAFWLALSLGLAACVQSDGPTPGEVRREAREAEVPILRLNPDVLSVLGRPASPSGFSGMATRPFTPGTIQPGDVIAVRVFEAGDEGVFSVASASSLELGEFAVSPSGSVSIPFVGTIRVAGNSVIAAERIVTERLRETAIDPEATVNIQVSPSSAFTVQGAVRSGGLFPLSARGERVLDAIALAGGVEGKPEDKVISLTRGSQVRRQSYSALLDAPGQNIALLPGDTVVVGDGEASFIADGALNAPGSFPFVEGELSLAQAVARAGGLQNVRANPAAVFVFRRQPPGESFLYRERSGTVRTITGDVIFQAMFDVPADRLDAQEFFLRDGDVLYVGDAPLAQFSKFFQIFNSPPQVPAPQDL